MLECLEGLYVVPNSHVPCAYSIIIHVQYDKPVSLTMRFLRRRHLLHVTKTLSARSGELCVVHPAEHVQA